MKPKAVSLHDELSVLAEALDGARMLAHLLACSAFDDDRDARRAPAVIEAELAMAKGRLDLVCRCLRDEADPRLLFAPHNDARDGPPQEGWTDVQLKVWDHPLERSARRAVPRPGMKHRRK